MKNSFKKRIRTKEKEEIYNVLAADSTIKKLVNDCLKAGASQLHLICLVAYCYQYGLEQGYANGFLKGRSAGIKIVHDEVMNHKNNNQDP